MVVTNDVVIDLDLAHHTFPTSGWKTLKGTFSQDVVFQASLLHTQELL